MQPEKYRRKKRHVPYWEEVKRRQRLNKRRLRRFDEDAELGWLERAFWWVTFVLFGHL
jgi:hypothetical protein